MAERLKNHHQDHAERHSPGQPCRFLRRPDLGDNGHAGEQQREQTGPETRTMGTRQQGEPRRAAVPGRAGSRHDAEHRERDAKVSLFCGCGRPPT